MPLFQQQRVSAFMPVFQQKRVLSIHAVVQKTTSSAFILLALDVAPMGLTFRARIATDDINVVPTEILPLRGTYGRKIFRPYHCDE